MGLFDIFKKKEPTDTEMREQLVRLVMKALTDRQNRIRAEDAICGMATIVGERAIDAAGDYPLRDHNFPPGQRVFSDRVNELLSSDRLESDITTGSVFGMLKAELDPQTYPPGTHPDPADIFRSFAAGIGKEEDWGKVPFTVPEENHPSILPLKFGFETRPRVDAILAPASQDKARCLRVAVSAMADLLNRMGGAIKPDLALRLAFEIINGMAKTAPMTEKAMRAAQK